MKKNEYYGYFSFAESITPAYSIFLFDDIEEKGFLGDGGAFDTLYFIGVPVVLFFFYLWGIRDAFKTERFRNANVFKTVLFTPGIILFLIGWNTGFSRLIVLAASFLYFWSKYRGYWFKKPELSTA